MELKRIGPLIALGVPLAASPLVAQLRPLEPLDWRVFEEDRSVVISVGVGVHEEQRASLAGTSGRLTELGNFQASWRSGIVALEASGTLMRRLREDARFANPFGGALDSDDDTRSDAGDYRLLTSVLVTPSDWENALVVRFGTRLPTTNNRVGLDRDQTDFFGEIGGRIAAGRALLTGETGVGIYGTRYANFEQSDLWIYSARAELPVGVATPFLAILGQKDLSSGEELRGNENLTEFRLGTRIGASRWLKGELLFGATDFSPGVGVLVSGGIAR